MVAERCCLLVLCLNMGACGSDRAGLTVVVEADQDVAVRSSRVLLEVRTQEGTVALSEQFDLVETPFPIHRLVTPRGGDATRVVSITARAVNSNGDTLTTARAIRSFVSGRIAELRMRLYELCLGTNCPDGFTCEPMQGRAECIDARVIDETNVDAGVDSNVDTGVGDGSECAVGFQRCGEICLAANTPNGCGPACTVCPRDSRGTALCTAGQCSIACNQGTELCETPNGQRCFDTQTDPNHCGTCGNLCSDEQLCVNGECVEPPQCDVNNPASCTGLTYCSPENNRCASGCDSRLSNQCGNHQTCSAHQCVCSIGSHDCSGVCLSNDSVNSCGQSCAPCTLASNASHMGCNGTSCTVRSCSTGYQVSSDQQSCEDIDECSSSNGGCDTNATCSNLPGGRTCACNRGFSGDGSTCMPLVLGDWEVDAFIKASNPGAGDYFGSSVALSSDGMTLAVGAYEEDSWTSSINGSPNESAEGSGAVYVFTRSNGGWLQQAFIKTSNAGVGHGFGIAVTLSSDGNTLAVGAVYENSSTTGINGTPNNLAEYSGAAYVFTRVSGNWSEQAFIKASNTEEGDRFGRSIALSSDGNTLAIGARDQGSSADDSGAVYVFTRVGGNWSEQAIIKASNPGAGDAFGITVALSSDGNTLAVGARGEDSATTGINGTPNELAEESGAAYVFIRSNGDWRQEAFIKASNAATAGDFGWAVTLSSDGHTLAVGARNESSFRNASGAVYVFTRAGANWAQQALIQAQGSGAGDGFGNSVALSSDGRTLAVGSVGEDSSTSGINPATDEGSRDSGAVYMFTRTSGHWIMQAFIKASNTGAVDELGSSLALSSDGSTLVGGAIYEDSSRAGINGTPNESARDSGAVYTYRR